ncbi:hypothetical protein FNW02_21115 [Komarekiella sp. 'clone 1']|uniref:Uncharacterized protein n=1 Tax=Komarekiella delphini-convector SJRDD-AB1 TaxID=2593771 RepID=A0AA40VTA3_9NOST|nr:hypothetical protein [Komarekiella delphini-convector]MBD6618256.1 hypothetical protein [Komarekiella delphini-convector SJRDD-AB1]
MRFSVYRNVGVAAFCLGLLGLVVGCFEMSVSFEAEPNISTQRSTETSQLERTPSVPVSPDKALSASLTTSATIPTKQVEYSTRENTHPVLTRNQSAGKAKGLGTLRMSNLTNQPVRLALLARQSGVKSAASKQANYDVPAHWDFAPKEGGEKGLILSLPQGNLKLEKGDILVAFAQDGSRRYWGPYVVGETPSPKWNTQNKEWQLVLSP